MTIKTGDRLPDATFKRNNAGDITDVTTSELCAGKKVVLFAVPGAFTPTCHKTHMPGFVARMEELKAKGFDTVACTAVNDVFVMSEWAKATNADGKVLMLADGGAEFAKKIGMDMDLTARGLGVRSKRYAMAISDGEVKVLNLEEAPGQVSASSAETLCSMVDKSL